MAATTTRQSIRDTFHAAAKTAGLTHVDGFGAYSVFEGDRTAWQRLADALATMPASRSVTAAKGRVEWALA